jgi:hypothetical protein
MATALLGLTLLVVAASLIGEAHASFVCAHMNMYNEAVYLSQSLLASANGTVAGGCGHRLSCPSGETVVLSTIDLNGGVGAMRGQNWTMVVTNGSAADSGTCIASGEAGGCRPGQATLPPAVSANMRSGMDYHFGGRDAWFAYEGRVNASAIQRYGGGMYSVVFGCSAGTAPESLAPLAPHAVGPLAGTGTRRPLVLACPAGHVVAVDALAMSSDEWGYGAVAFDRPLEVGGTALWTTASTRLSDNAPAASHATAQPFVAARNHTFNLSYAAAGAAAFFDAPTVTMTYRYRGALAYDNAARSNSLHFSYSCRRAAAGGGGGGGAGALYWVLGGVGVAIVAFGVAAAACCFAKQRRAAQLGADDGQVPLNANAV